MRWGRHDRHSLESAIVRFMAKVKQEESGCWTWIGSKGGGGRYGSVAIAGHVYLAHRGSWLLFRGDPTGMNVCHKCDNGMCVNPDHLFLGTQRDNVLDMESKRRSKHPKGASHGRAKLTQAQVDEIRASWQNESIASLARKFSVSPPTIKRIVNGSGWVTT